MASDRPARLYGGTLGFGPWAHGVALAPQGAPMKGPTRCHSDDFGVKNCGMALAPLGGPVIRTLPDVILMTVVLGVAKGRPNVILMTEVLAVASDRPACLYGGTLGFGPCAHGMVLAPLGGPVIRALPDVILMTLVLGVANGQPNVVLMT